MSESNLSGTIYYGCFWRFDAKDPEAVAVLRDALEATDDTDLDDMLDDLCEKFDAHLNYDGKDRTIVFGHPITSVNESDNSFREMDLLSVMDLQKGSLQKGIRESMTNVIAGVPYGLRDNLSSPKFCIAWSR